MSAPCSLLTPPALTLAQGRRDDFAFGFNDWEGKLPRATRCTEPQGGNLTQVARLD